MLGDAGREFTTQAAARAAGQTSRAAAGSAIEIDGRRVRTGTVHASSLARGRCLVDRGHQSREQPSESARHAMARDGRNFQSDCSLCSHVRMQHHTAAARRRRLVTCVAIAVPAHDTHLLAHANSEDGSCC